MRQVRDPRDSDDGGRHQGEAVVRLERSFFADAMRATGKPECYIVAGRPGAARVSLKKDLSCTEERCGSKGDESCQVRLTPK